MGRSKGDQRTLDNLLGYVDAEQDEFEAESLQFYNYEKHLRPMGQLGGTFIPAGGEDAPEVLYTTGDTKEDCLNEQERVRLKHLQRRNVILGDRGERDEDYVAALDGRIDNLEELEDDFLDQILGEDLEDLKDLKEREGLEDKRYVEEKELEGGTEYVAPMSMGTVQRPQTQAERAMNDHFDFLMAEYSDEDIGDLEEMGSDVEGHLDMTSATVADTLRQYMEQEEERMARVPGCEFNDTFLDPKIAPEQIAAAAETQEKTIQLLQRLALTEDPQESISSEALDRMIQKESFSRQRPRQEWDCQSILSRGTTASAAPTLIQETVRSKPKRTPKVKEHISSEEDATTIPEPNPVYYAPRPKEETPEEKRERKQVVKEQRRLNRERKKRSKELYKKEQQEVAREMLQRQQLNPPRIPL